MTGWFEARCDGGDPRRHYRVFCLLDYDAPNTNTPLLLIITGMSKPLRTKFTESDYRKVRDLVTSTSAARRAVSGYTRCLRALPVCFAGERFATAFPDRAFLFSRNAVAPL